jgi:RNA polymerase sigma factor (sigma-70 family)
MAIAVSISPSRWAPRPADPPPHCERIGPGGTTILQSDAIAAVHDGFRNSRAADVGAVRDWIQSVVRAGNWHFGDPEAVVQDILVKLIEIVRRGRVQEPGGFQKFVYTVAKNTCVTVYHRERRRRERESSESAADDLPAGTDPHVPMEQRERLEAMVVIYQRLPEACRQLWRWVYGDGFSAAEVAKRLGITVNNVRVRVHRCLEKARGIRDELARPAEA